MALIKAPATVKVKLQDKTVSLPVEVWKKLNEYARFAGIGGKPAEKVNYIIEQALLSVFESDKEFNAPKAETKPEVKAAAAPVAPKK